MQVCAYYVVSHFVTKQLEFTVYCTTYTTNQRNGNFSRPQHMDACVTRMKQQFKFLLKIRPPLWSSGQSSCLLTQRSWLRFPELPDFLVAVGLERGPFSLVRTNEDLLEGKIAAPV
jgi:hypothetical protein